MNPLDLTQLSSQQRAELVKEAKELERQEKQRKAETRNAFKELSAEFVAQNIDFWAGHQKATAQAVERLWNDFKPLRELKALAYGTKINEQDSHTSTLEDGSASITIGYNVSIGFDGTESAGVEKIKNFITSLSDDSEKVKKLAKMVHTFLKPNAKTGMLNPSKIIELSKLRDEFHNEEFNQGLDIIFNAQIRRQNSMYVSGWKYEQVEGLPKKIEFRFTI